MGAERGRPAWRLGVAGLVAAVLVAELVLVGPTLGRSLRALPDADPAWLAVAVAAAAVSMGCFARTRRRLLAATGTLVRQRDALAAVYVANAVHATMPGGAAFSAAYTYRWMRTRGAAPAAIAWTLVSGGLLSTSALTALGIAGSLLAEGRAGLGALALDAGAVLLLALGGRALARHPERVLGALRRVADRLAALLRRPPGRGSAALDRLAAQLTLVRPRRRDWAVAAGFALANWAFDAGCLLASSRALHVAGAPLSLVLLAYTAGMAANSLSLLPGGIGVVDTAMVLVLVAGGIPVSAALPAVLLYRLIAFVGVIAAGWIVAAAGRWRLPAGERLAPTGRL